MNSILQRFKYPQMTHQSRSFRRVWRIGRSRDVDEADGRGVVLVRGAQFLHDLPGRKFFPLKYK